TAVLDVNDLKIILISLRWQTLDPEILRFVGIDPLADRIIDVQSSIHYRAPYDPLAQAIIEADEPGLSPSHLARPAFKRVRRPSSGGSRTSRGSRTSTTRSRRRRSRTWHPTRSPSWATS